MKAKIKIPDNSTIIHTHGLRNLKEEPNNVFIGVTDDIDDCTVLIRKEIHSEAFKPVIVFDALYPEPLEKPKKYVPEPEGGPMPEDEKEPEEPTLPTKPTEPTLPTKDKKADFYNKLDGFGF